MTETRVTLVVTFLDGSKVELPRYNLAEANATIDARYRTGLVSKIRVVRFPPDRNPDRPPLQLIGEPDAHPTH